MARTPRFLSRLAALLLCVVAYSADARAQMTLEQAQALMNRPSLKAAFAFVDKNRAATLNEWSAITEINAPSGKERRAPGTSRNCCAPTT